MNKRINTCPVWNQYLNQSTLLTFLLHAQSINKQIYIMKETNSQGMSKEQF